MVAARDDTLPADGAAVYMRSPLLIPGVDELTGDFTIPAKAGDYWPLCANAGHPETAKGFPRVDVQRIYDGKSNLLRRSGHPKVVSYVSCAERTTSSQVWERCPRRWISSAVGSVSSFENMTPHLAPHVQRMLPPIGSSSGNSIISA